MSDDYTDDADGWTEDDELEFILSEMLEEAILGTGDDHARCPNCDNLLEVAPPHSPAPYWCPTCRAYWKGSQL